MDQSGLHRWKLICRKLKMPKNSSVWVNLCICLQILWVFSDACGHFHPWAKLTLLRRRITRRKPGFVWCWIHNLLPPSSGKSEKKCREAPKTWNTLCRDIFTTHTLSPLPLRSPFNPFCWVFFNFLQAYSWTGYFFLLEKQKTKTTCLFFFAF